MSHFPSAAPPRSGWPGTTAERWASGRTASRGQRPCRHRHGIVSAGLAVVPAPGVDGRAGPLPEGRRAARYGPSGEEASGARLLDVLAEWGLKAPVVVADAGYGVSTPFRLALEERGLASGGVQPTGANGLLHLLCKRALEGELSSAIRCSTNRNRQLPNRLRRRTELSRNVLVRRARRTTRMIRHLRADTCGVERPRPTRSSAARTSSERINSVFGLANSGYQVTVRI